MLTHLQQKEIEAKVIECIQIVEAKFPVRFEMPKIDYNLRGTTAGKAWIEKWKLQFHPILAAENWDDYINNTVPHEVAHLAVAIVYPNTMKRSYGGKRSVHGAEWQHIMHILGADPSRCHSYDVSQVKQKQTTYTYQCQRCETKFNISSKRHTKIINGASYYHERCGGKIAVVYQPVIAAKVNKINKVSLPKEGTNLARAYELYCRFSRNYDRTATINMFVFELGLGYNTANTYFYKCKQFHQQGV